MALRGSSDFQYDWIEVLIGSSSDLQWMVAIFRDQRNRMDTSEMSDLHRMHEITPCDQMGDGLHEIGPRSDGRWDHDRDLNRKTHLRTRGTLWRVRFSSNRDLNPTA